MPLLKEAPAIGMRLTVKPSSSMIRLPVTGAVCMAKCPFPVAPK
jgi:hypothetical protein